MSTQISNRYRKHPALLMGVSQKKFHVLERVYGTNAATLKSDEQQSLAWIQCRSCVLRCPNGRTALPTPARVTWEVRYAAACVYITEG